MEWLEEMDLDLIFWLIGLFLLGFTMGSAMIYLFYQKIQMYLDASLECKFQKLIQIIGKLK